MSNRRTHFFARRNTEGDPSRKDLLGGKGSSLAAMSKADLPVPPGFTISAECCPQYLDGGGSWPEGLKDEVKMYMTRLEEETGRIFGKGPKPLLVSVRSGAAVSMPGMMDTILNCGIHPGLADEEFEGFWRVYAQFCMMFSKTVADIPVAEFDKLEEEVTTAAGKEKGQLDEENYKVLSEKYRAMYEERSGKTFPAEPWTALFECIEAVFNSWNSERAITYRKQHDIRGIAGTAVNIQTMFPSEISGIAFTTNPQSLEANEMIFEASYGLGESIVSGDVTPDRITVDRDSLAIKETVMGNKAHSVRALGDRTEHDPSKAALTEEQIAELAQISKKVEEYFGVPVDLEWGIAEGKFSLLQSRPIRGLDIAQDVEVGRKEEIKRLLEIAGDEHRVWVTHNLGETLGAPTPLTWDIVKYFMSGDGGFGQMYKDFGYRPSDRVCKEGFLELICGRIYADPDRAAGLFWEGMPLEYDVEAILKDQNAMEAPPTVFKADKADAAFLLRLPGTIWAMIRSSRRMNRLRVQALERFQKEILPSYLDYVKQKRAQDLTSLSVADLIAELKSRCVKVMDEFSNESLKPGFFGGMARAALEANLTQLMGEDEGKKLALNLTMGLDGDMTIEQNTCLYKVAQGEVTLEKFLEEYGHRTVGEMELSEPRWHEDPAYLKKQMAALKGTQATSPEDLHHANAEKRKEAEEALPKVLAEWGGSCFREEIQADLENTQKLLPFRENGKHYLMMGYDLIRRVIVELSNRWDLGRDIFFLKWDELPRYEQEKEALAEQISKRKVRWNSAKRLEMPDVVDSKDLDELGKPRVYEAASELKGDPIAAGVYTGIARVVHDPNEDRDLGAEFVLICPSTDPGWTALFVNTKGLVIERGGILSHGAIVARDFGIPAVVCPDATRRIKDGQKVRVDGNQGLITIVDE